MKEIIIDFVKESLGLSDAEINNNFRELPEIHAFYFWSSKRGGNAVIINEQGEKLIANSAVRFDDHLKAFIAGKRN